MNRSRIPVRPVTVPTSLAILVVLALIALKWVYFPDDEFELREEHPTLAVEPPPKPVLDPLALEAALAAASRWPVKSAVILVIPCDDPAQPMFIGPHVDRRTKRYCGVVLLDDTE